MIRTTLAIKQLHQIPISSPIDKPKLHEPPSCGPTPTLIRSQACDHTGMKFLSMFKLCLRFIKSHIEYFDGIHLFVWIGDECARHHRETDKFSQYFLVNDYEEAVPRRFGFLCATRSYPLSEVLLELGP